MTAREFWWSVVVSALLTVGLFAPLPWHLSTLAYQPLQTDGQFSVWNVAWVAHALLTHPSSVAHANIFFPHTWTLFYSEPNLLAGLLAVPAYWWTGSPYAATNSVVLLTFVASATATYALCRHLIDDRWACAVGAVGFAYAPHVVSHLLHIQLLMTAGLPLSLLALHRLVDAPSPRRGAWLGVALTAQAYGCGYYAVFAILAVGLGLLVFLTASHQWHSPRAWRGIGIAVVLSIAATAPLAAGYAHIPADGFRRTLESSVRYAADWRAYFASAARAHEWMLTHLGHWNEVLFPGFLFSALGCLGLVAGWRDRRLRAATVFYGLLTGLACWASFGPAAGLYRWLYAAVPGFSLMRAPSRFGLLVVLGLSVLSAFAVAWINERLPRRRAVLGLALVVLAVADRSVAVHYEPVPPVAPVYGVLSRLPPGPVLELPIFSHALAFRRSGYMLASTSHWNPLIDGYSDYIPEDFVQRVEAIADFPTTEAFEDLSRDRVRYAVLHLDHYGPDARRAVLDRLRAFAPALRERFRDADTILVEIVASRPVQMSREP